jgi:hypothetical protein
LLCLIVPPTKIELVRRIACLADNQINMIFTDKMNIVGVAGRCGSGSKFIVASIINPPALCERCHLFVLWQADHNGTDM